MSVPPYFLLILKLILSEQSESKDPRLPRCFAPRNDGKMKTI